MAELDDEKKKPKPLKADDFVGPPQEQPWDKWTPEQRAHADNMINVLDGIKLYRSAGGAGVGVQHRQNALRLAQQGGLDPDEALTLARYRMSKQPKGPVPNGEREPADTPETVGARRAELFAAPEEDRAGMMADQKARGYLTEEGYYDSLARKRPEPAAPNEVVDNKQVIERAKGLLGKGRVNAPEKKMSDNERRERDALEASMRRKG